jgi:hypothetical protein
VVGHVHDQVLAPVFVISLAFQPHGPWG